MFSSISECQPNTAVSTSFTVTNQQILTVDANVTISVNDVVANANVITVQTGDVITATVTTPSGFLDFQIHEYALDSVKQYFAVVNKNDYRPTVKPSDVGKRWFNYAPAEFRVSFYASIDPFQRPLGSGRRFIDIANTHIALDHINAAVCFYSTGQELISRVNLPSGPIEYQKITYYDSSLGTDVTEALILCADKKLYRIRFDNRYTDSEEYKPTVIPVEVADNLWFEQDLPTGESFIESRRNAFLSKLKPPTTALDVTTNKIWIAGYDAVYILNRNFQQTNKIDLPDEKIINIAALNNDAIAVTRDGKVLYISSQGTYTLLLQTSALGSPCSINSGLAVAVPDPDNQRLLIFTDNSGSYTTWLTEDFAPAYARVFDNKLWVTGYDSNRILEFNNDGTYSSYYFSDKVTVVSVLPGSILAMHYLQDFVTLDLTGIRKIIPVKFSSKQGPLGHIGSEPVRIKMLGEENIPIYTSPGLTAWVNGIVGEPAKTGDYIGVSYRAEYNGKFTGVAVVGDRAYDYSVIAESSVRPGDYFEPVTVARNRLSAPFATYVPPDSGDQDTGITGPIDLDFNWNFSGQNFNQIYVSTDGLVYFAQNGVISTNTLHVEPGNLYQGGAVNNVNPNNIYEKLSSNETPGLYIKNGTLSEFNYLRLRWVGTEYSSNLFGITKSVTSNITASFNIPISSTQGLEVGTYVSGEFISNTTQVSNVVSYSRTVDLLKISPSFDRLHINNLENFIYETYSDVIGLTSGNVDVVDLITNVSLPGKILSVSGNIIKTSIDIPIFNTDFYSVRIPLINGTTIIDSNIADITQIENTFTAINVLDNARFTVGEQEYSELYVGQLIFHPNVGSGDSFNTISGKSFSEIDGFIIRTTTTHSLVGGESITSRYNDIEFNQAVPINTLPGGEMLLFNYSLRVGDSNKFANDSQLILRANIAVVDQPLNLQSGQELLFANDYAAPDYTYEVGLYQGKNYQYVEFFYDSNNHKLDTIVGINLGQTTQNGWYNIPTAKSIVFSGNLSNGVFDTFNGIGSFNEISNSFRPRNITYIKSITDNQQQDRIEIFIDRNLTVDDKIKISADYGYLTVNSTPYYGDSYITENSIISLKTPFNTSFRGIAPIIGIGDLQVSVPMISRAVTNIPQQIVELYDNQTPNNLVTANVTIPVTGTYFIPDYYRYPNILSNLDIEFKRIRNGSTLTLDWGNYEFIAGDIIQVNRQLIPRGLYDHVDVDLVGPVWVKLRWRTSSGSLFNNLTFETLDNAFTRREQDYLQSNVGDIIVYDELDDYHQTSNLTLSSTGLMTGNLYVDTPETQFIVNGVQAGNYISSVSTGANIALRRQLLNYFQSNVDIYQLKYDSLTRTNVYIPVGVWSINNKSILGSVTESPEQILTTLLSNPSFSNVTVLSTELSLPENYETNVIRSVMPTVELFKKQYPDSTDNNLVSELIPYSLNEVNADITPEIFGRTNINAQGIISESESIDNILRSLISASNVSMIDSILSSSILNDKEVIKSVASANLTEQKLSPESKFGFSISQAKENLQNILKSSLSKSLVNKYSILLNAISEDLEKHKTSNLFLNDPEFENLVSIDKNDFLSQLENKINYSFDVINLNLDNSKSIFKSLILSNSEVLSNVLTDQLVLELEKSKNSLLDNLNLSVEKLKTNVLDSLTMQLSIGKQLIFEKITQDLEVNKTKSFDSLTLAQERDTTLLTSKILADLELNKNVFNDSLQLFLEGVKSITTGKITNDLVTVSVLLTYILDAAIESERTVVGDKLLVDFSSIKSNLVYTLTGRIDALETNLKGKISEILDNLLTLVDVETDVLIDPTKNNIVGKFFELLDQITTSISQSIQPHIDQLVNLIIKTTENIIEQKNTQLSTDLEARDTAVFSIIQLLLDIAKDEKNYSKSNIEYVKDKINHIIYGIEYAKDQINILPYRIEYVKDELNFIQYGIEYVKSETNYINIIPLRVFETKSYIFQPVEVIFEPKMEWYSDNLDSTGAVKTQINIYADNGRGGDKITNMGDPPDRNPILLYSKNYDYGLGSFIQGGMASDMAVKYVNASAFQIFGTDYWNYRIYFDKKVYSIPKKGMIFPIKWFIRGG